MFDDWSILQLLLLITIGVFFSVLVANYAENRGRSWWTWFWLAFILNPLISFIIVLILGESKICEHCAEHIKPQAKVCRYCGRDVK